MDRWDTGATADRGPVRGTARVAGMGEATAAAVGTAAVGVGAVMGGTTHTGEAREAWLRAGAVAERSVEMHSGMVKLLVTEAQALANKV
jgi:hypothetical protein